jgi:hypothetical protein
MNRSINNQVGLFAALLFSLIFPANTVRAADWQISVGKQAATGDGRFTVYDGDRLLVSLNENRSYCCQVDTENSGVLESTHPYFASEMVTAISGSGTLPLPITGTYKGLDSPPVTEGYQQTSAGQSRVCFITPDIGPLWVAVFALPIAAPQGVSTNVRASCEETTLFGGYNTNVSEFNFLEVTNTGTFATDIVAIIRDMAGAELDRLVWIHPAGVRIDIDIHSRVGAGNYGSIIIDSAGPRGSIKAVLSEYKITSRNPLAFEPTVKTVFAGN